MSNDNWSGIRIAVADDHPLILSSIRTMTEMNDHLILCGAYHSGAALMEGLKKDLPDILILDYHLPDGNGGELSQYITYHHPQVKILILTGYDEPELVSELLRKGCMGFMQKTFASPEALLEAIDNIYNGQMYIHSAVRDQYAASIQASHKNEKESVLRLTTRELEVLRAIAGELSSKQIADKLHISKRTVDSHRNSILLKSGVKNTAGLIRLAMELKLLS